MLNSESIETAIEFGCGDGHQLGLIDYPTYEGLDVSAKAISICQAKFKTEPSKIFKVYNPQKFQIEKQADLVVCFDVLFHIVDENDFLKTLKDIFESAKKYIVFTTNLKPISSKHEPHIRCRDIMPYFNKYKNFKVDKIIERPIKEGLPIFYIQLKTINYIQN